MWVFSLLCNLAVMSYLPTGIITAGKVCLACNDILFLGILQIYVTYSFAFKSFVPMLTNMGLNKNDACI